MNTTAPATTTTFRSVVLEAVAAGKTCTFWAYRPDGSRQKLTDTLNGVAIGRWDYAVIC